MRAARVAQVAIVAGAVLWVAGLLFWPQTLFPVGRLICHQRPDRSFFLHGRQLPVCARCTGLYVGAALAAPVAVIAAAVLSASMARTILAVAAVPTLLTWTIEFLGFGHFSNSARFLAALPLGIASAWLVLSVLSEQSTTRARRHR